MNDIFKHIHVKFILGSSDFSLDCFDKSIVESYWCCRQGIVGYWHDFAAVAKPDQIRHFTLPPKHGDTHFFLKSKTINLCHNY